MRNRPFTRAVRLGLAGLVAAAGFAVTAGPARAVVTEVGFSQEGTFWRQQQRAPIVDIPCQAPVPPDRCGPASPGPTQSPQVTEGNVAVGHSGGQVAAEGGDAYGDQYWAVFELDLLSIEDLDTVNKLELAVTRAPDGRNDYGTPVMMACNVVTPFGVSEGTNPWADRPSLDCSAAKSPVRTEVNSAHVYTFNITDYASTWVAGTGYGVALVPGVPGSTQVVNDPSRTNDVAPFLVTFSASGKLDASGKPHSSRARAVADYQPGSGDDELDLDLGDESDLGFGLGGEVGEFDIGDELSASGDEFASDLGDLGAGEADPGEAAENAAGGRVLRSRPAGTSGGFPWAVLLLLPLAAFAFWGTGTALGEAGDPTPPRQGGVSRILARRRAASGLPIDSPR